MNKLIQGKQTPFSRYFKKCDLYGRRVDFYINNKIHVKSKFGAFVSFLVVGLAFYLFFINIVSWYNLEDLTIISSSKSMSVNELLTKNQSYVYDFNYLNYYVYVALSATFPNGTMLNYEQLQPYVDQHFFYTDQTWTVHNLTFSKCSVYKQDIFLQQEAQSNLNKTSNWDVCIDQNYSMGLFTDQDTRVVNQSMITYKINKCRNTTENNFACASEEEIENMLQYITVQATIPKSVYDFNNPKDVRKRTYDYQIYHLDINLIKWYTGTLVPVYMNTDMGYFSDDYRLDTVDFNVESLVYETNIRGQNNDLLFEYDLTFFLDQQIYYRKNIKLNIILANFGGILNVLFLLGKLICHSYNFLVLKHQLINISFRNLESMEDKKGKFEKGGKTLTNKNLDNKFKFSIFSFLCPNLIKQKVYDDAFRNLYEYMDIKNIIKRLQDIDKMKLILFDEKQRKLFEILPKPGITGNLRKKTTYLTMDSLVESKNSKEKESFHKFGFLLNGDPVNKRMLDMIDPVIKNELDKKEESTDKLQLSNLDSTMHDKSRNTCFIKKEIIVKPRLLTTTSKIFAKTKYS